MRPTLTLQLAHSSDGYTTRRGERTPLTGLAAWQRIYQDRARTDAIMIGINTALLDNPVLTSHGLGKNPVRIVVDTHARLKTDSQLAQTAHETPTWVLTATDNPALTSLGVRLIQCPLKDGQIDLHAALEKLDGIDTIICEGGATLAQALNTQDLIDKMILIESDTVLGDGIRLPVLTNFRFENEDRIETDTFRRYIKRSSSSPE